MSQLHERRNSDNAFIDTVWRSQNMRDGVYLATPDGSWDLISGTQADGSRMILLTGQATKPAYIPYTAGSSSVVISFAAGAYLPHLRDNNLLNSGEQLTMIDDEHFLLAGLSFPFPTFDKAEDLVNQMVQLGVLKNDAIVDGVLRGMPKAASKRAVQRHFKTTTGLTLTKIRNIHRAQSAVKLLQEGKNPSRAAQDAGYYDQAHLTKALKQIMDATPSNIDDIHKL